jgi:hypothetical protein
LTEYNAGEARLRIVPDASQFRQKLEAEIRRVNAELPVEANTRKAAERIDMFRREQSARDVNITVDVDTRRATAEMASLRAELDKFSAGALGTGKSLKDSFSIAGAAAFAAFNPAVITSVASVAQALQQVSQAGLVIPGVIGGAAASIGTLTLGMSGMGDAIKAAGKAADGSAKDIQAYNDALKKLSPNAAETVRAIADLKPQFDDIKNSVSDKMLDGIGASMRQLVAADFPTFKKGLTGIAQAFNTDFKQLGLSLGDGKTQSIFDRLFGNTADAQTRVAKAIDPLVKGIGTLVAGSSDALPRLADGLGKVAERFDKFIESADKDGRLAKWIDEGLKGTTKLGESVLNIGKAFTAITKAMGGGDGFLGGLERVTGKMQTFLNSDEGQDKLKRMFAAGRAELEQLKPIVDNLAKILPAMFDAAQNSANIWLPTLKVITDILASDPELVEAVTSAFLAWKTISGITSLLDTLGILKNVLKVDLPLAADTGAAGISRAFSAIAIPAALLTIMQWERGHEKQAAMDAGKTDMAPIGPRGMMVPVAPSASSIPNVIGGNGPHGEPAWTTGGGGGFASGGMVSGPGNGTSDSIPAWLSHGEFVVNAASTEKNRGLLEHINARGYAGGGAIDKENNFWQDQNGVMRQGLATNQLPTGAQLQKAQQLTGTGFYNPAMTSWLGIGGGNFNPKMAIDTSMAGWGTPDPYASWTKLTGGFANGGFVGPTTPSPLQAGMSSMAQAALGPLGGMLGGGPIGNFVNMLNAPAPDPSTQTVSQQMGMTGPTAFGTPEGNFMQAASTLPGLWGALASMNSPDPAGTMMNWGTNTVGWLSNFASNTMSSFGSSLLNGALGAVGLQQSILSPSNPYTGAVLQGANFALGGSGPIAGLMNSKGGGGSSGGGGSTSLAGSGGGGMGGMGLSDLFGVNPGGGGSGGNLPLNWKTIDALAAQQGLSMTSGYRSPNGPTIAGVAASKSYHALGRAHDYSNGVRTSQELAFAMFMAQNYGPKLKELIFDDPRFAYTINNGAVKGPFGSFYTMGQAGDHTNHVHVAFDTGGWLQPGQTMAHNNTNHPELIVNKQGQQKLADQGINPSSLLEPGAPGQPPSSPADTAGKLLDSAKLPTIGAAPASQDHNLSAISKGISAGASAIGNLASSAIGAGMAAAGAPGGGGAGALASTAIQMGGQLLSGAVNLGSSLLVGSVPGSFGGNSDRAYGKQVHTPAPQQAPPVNATTWNVNGVSDISRLIQEVDLRDAQHRAGLAKWGG